MDRIEIISPQIPPKTSSKKKLFFILTAVLVFIAINLGARFLWAFNSVQIENTSLFNRVSNYINNGKVPAAFLPIEKEYEMPKKEETRYDILFLGIRGDDPQNSEAGNLLTDSIMLFSYDSAAKKSSLISIPRDLYLKIPGAGKSEKINTIYVLGLEKRKPISYPKEIFSRITGVYIDKVVVADFKAFEELVNLLGGVQINLAKPFIEKQQWGYEFSLPAGPNTLTGEQALYYVRSRYSTSDFDRAHRQQEVLFALKAKIAALGLLKDSAKLNTIVKILEKNIRTDIGALDTPKILSLYNSVSGTKISRYLITTENLVYESHINGAYVLLPKGDNLDEIKKLFEEILK